MSVVARSLTSMSTTIDVYPTTTTHLPLVEETRRRTEELFQQLLDCHGIESTITVRATTRAEGATATSC